MHVFVYYEKTLEVKSLCRVHGFTCQPGRVTHICHFIVLLESTPIGHGTSENVYWEYNREGFLPLMFSCVHACALVSVYVTVC